MTTLPPSCPVQIIVKPTQARKTAEINALALGDPSPDTIHLLVVDRSIALALQTAERIHKGAQEQYAKSLRDGNANVLRKRVICWTSKPDPCGGCRVVHNERSIVDAITGPAVGSLGPCRFLVVVADYRRWGQLTSVFRQVFDASPRYKLKVRELERPSALDCSPWTWPVCTHGVTSCMTL